MLSAKIQELVIAEDELESILKHADADLADMLICGYESAMRCDEICKLTAGQVKLDILMKS